MTWHHTPADLARQPPRTDHCYSLSPAGGTPEIHSILQSRCNLLRCFRSSLAPPPHPAAGSRPARCAAAPSQSASTRSGRLWTCALGPGEGRSRSCSGRPWLVGNTGYTCWRRALTPPGWWDRVMNDHDRCTHFAQCGGADSAGPCMSSVCKTAHDCLIGTEDLVYVIYG